MNSQNYYEVLGISPSFTSKEELMQAVEVKIADIKSKNNDSNKDVQKEIDFILDICNVLASSEKREEYDYMLRLQEARYNEYEETINKYMEKITVQDNLFIKRGPKRLSAEDAERLNITFRADEVSQVSQGMEDWSYTNRIFRLNISENGLELNSLNSPVIYSDSHQVTINQLIKEYITLSEFLETAQYIGRKGHRIKPTENGDTSYMANDNKIIIYAGENHMIAYEEQSNGPRIELIPGDFANINDWEFVGPQLDLYSNPKNLLEHFQSIDSVKHK